MAGYAITVLVLHRSYSVILFIGVISGVGSGAGRSFHLNFSLWENYLIVENFSLFFFYFYIDVIDVNTQMYTTVNTNINEPWHLRLADET